jgi:hypothetical protein
MALMAKKITQTLQFLFFATLVTFPTGQVLRLQLPNNINVSLFDIAVVLTGTFWLLTMLLGNKKYQSYFLTKPLLLFFLAILVSLAANIFRHDLTEIGIALLYALRWLLFVCIYFVVKEVDQEFRVKIPTLLTIIGTGVVAIGYIQYFFYSNLRNLYYLGWDEHMLRMFSSFLDPNFAGAFFVLFFLFLSGQIFAKYSGGNTYTILSFPRKRESMDPRSKSGMTKDLIWKNITLYCLSFVTFIAIFLTTSRSALIMLFVGLFTFLLLIGKKKWIFIVFGITVGIFILASRFFYIENINPLRVTSSIARIESAANALHIISRDPIFGVGFNAYRYAQYDYGFRSRETEYPSHADSSTDNSFLFVFATTGIVGLAAFLYLLSRIYALGIRQHDRVFGKILVASLIGLCVNSIFINSLFYPLLLYWLVVLAGITDYT